MLATNQIFRIIIGWILGICLFSSALATGYSAPKLANDSLPPHRWGWVAAGATYGLAQVGLYAAWYRSQAQQSFRFFDDGAQWKQVDKVGHFYSAFHISQASAGALRRTGSPRTKSSAYGSLIGFLALLPTEILDGFSSAYGFSGHDLAANAAGSVFFLGQQVLWRETRLHPKFSFHRTALAAERPGTLGSNLPEEVLKDYNGQTYWLSVDLHAFLQKKHPRFPKWLNVAVGYGAERMIYARTSANEAAGYTAYREFYLSLDLDLRYYRRRPVTFGNKLWNGLLYTLNLVHLPAPALSYQTGRGWVFYPLYF